MITGERILGIDYGSKRLGLAVTDPLGVLASGIGVIENDNTMFSRIAREATEREITLIVVGMPYAPDGGKGKKGEEVERFISRLKESLPLPIETWDESQSSVNAQRAMVAGGMKRKRRREKGRVDEMAARLLLQEYLDARSRG